MTEKPARYNKLAFNFINASMQSYYIPDNFNNETFSAGPQSYVVERNLLDVMAGKIPQARYNGYGACPLITSYSKGMLAEFLYDKKLCSTFPFDQVCTSSLLCGVLFKKLFLNLECTFRG